MKYNIECPRCYGKGRYDRGTCFECKGSRCVQRTRKPATAPRILTVTYENGTKNTIKMYFFSLEHAIKAVEFQMAAQGWKGTVNEQE